MSAKSAQMQRLLDQLAEAENRVMGLAEDIRELVTKEGKQYPPEPSASSGKRFTVSLKFTPNGPVYEYLVLRSNDRWYTTGTVDSYFGSWKEFIDWLQRPEVYWHSSFSPLRIAGSPVVGNYTRLS